MDLIVIAYMLSPNQDLSYYSQVPTITRIKGYRFFFFSGEGSEPPHIHVEKGNALAKFWLDPVSLARSKGFKQHEISQLRKLVEKHRRLFVKYWYEFFKAQDKT